MLLGDEKLLPAKLKILSGNTVQVEISQGIYHQIKRMFKKHGITVLALKRTAMGNVLLDEKLALGECRYLTDEEIAQICKKQ